MLSVPVRWQSDSLQCPPARLVLQILHQHVTDRRGPDWQRAEDLCLNLNSLINFCPKQKLNRLENISCLLLCWLECCQLVNHLNSKLFIFTGGKFHRVHYLCWREAAPGSGTGQKCLAVCQVIEGLFNYFRNGLTWYSPELYLNRWPGKIMRGILIISWDQFMRPLLFVPLHVSSLMPADWYVNPLILPVYTGFFSTFKWKLNSLGKPYQNLQPGPGGVSLVLEMLFIYYWLKQEWSWLRHPRLARTVVTCDVWCVMCDVWM